MYAARLPQHGWFLSIKAAMSLSGMIMGRKLAIALLLWSQSVSAAAGEIYDLEYEMTLSMIERHKLLDIPVRTLMPHAHQRAGVRSSFALHSALSNTGL